MQSYNHNRKINMTNTANYERINHENSNYYDNNHEIIHIKVYADLKFLSHLLSGFIAKTLKKCNPLEIVTSSAI